LSAFVRIVRVVSMTHLRAPKPCSYLMHRPHRSDWSVGRPVGVGHTDYTRISDGVSRCGELFDLTDCTARVVWEVPLNQQFSFP